MRAAARLWTCLAGMLGMLAIADRPAHATPPAPPVLVRLAIDGRTLRWELLAYADAALEAPAWASVPAGALTSPPALPQKLGAGERASGQAALAPGTEWIELRIAVRTGFGRFETGGAARAPTSEGEGRLRLGAAKPGAAAGTVAARFLLEDRILDARGYSGEVQLLPVRYADAEIVADTTGAVLSRGSVDGEGRLLLECEPPPAGRVSLRLLASTRGHPAIRFAVLDPDTLTREGVESAPPHELRTAAFEIGPGGADLGTLVLSDPDGRGSAQAFHILDVAIDAWEALAGGGLLEEAPGPADSLRFVWSRDLRLRGTAYGGGLVQVTSPVSGDTDGWCDPILLHEIGHFVAQRWLGDSSPGGLHLLGDVEQNLELAWSEGFASAFACWVREHRAATRRNAAGLPVDAHVSLVVDVSLPPPVGTAGGLQWAWDLERHALGERLLPRDGCGSETTVAGVLWDASDDAATADDTPGDDDPAPLGPAPVWEALRGLRDLPAHQPVRFEEFFASWAARDPGGAALAPILRDARIEYEPDAAEPDSGQPPLLAAARPREARGGVVLSEIVLGVRIAVEITNRSTEPVALGGWSLVARSNTASTAPGLTFRIPAGFVLGPGGRVTVHRSSIDADGVRDLGAPFWVAPWFPGIEGACMLLDAGGAGVDFVRWNSLDGTRSVIAPPPGTGWSGELAAPDFGTSLGRRPDVADSDDASDFVTGEPTPGAPNDVRSIHRTFFPENDTDAVRLVPGSPGVYTLAARRLRNGAAPRLEIWSTGAARPLVQALASPGVPPRVTLRIGPGEILEARCAQEGTTRFGSYDLHFFAEPDSAMPLPPVALRGAVQVAGGHGSLRLEWRNTAHYDSLQTRTGGNSWRTLPGDATAWEEDLPQGRHPVEIAAHAGGRRSRTIAMLVAVEPWSESFGDDFDSLDTGLWETTGTWAAVPGGGRAGHVLASSPAGDYTDNARGEVRLRTAVLAGPETVLRFDHVCIVRPEDAARLEISDDWGATWRLLGSWNWNDADGGQGPANWRDGAADSTDWVAEELPLAGWAGNPVQVRFVFESDIHGVARGWFVDALRIEPRETAPPPPFALRLLPSAPNPFNPGTRLRFELSQPADVVLRIFDVRGRLLCTLVDGPLGAGPHEVLWRGEDGRGRALAAGVYVAEVRAGGLTRTTKLVRID